MAILNRTAITNLTEKAALLQKFEAKDFVKPLSGQITVDKTDNVKKSRGGNVSRMFKASVTENYCVNYLP